jgi:GNAT superfamily N-acetyltransferase
MSRVIAPLAGFRQASSSGSRAGMNPGKVRPAQAADIEPVCRLLHEQMNARLSPDRWRQLMTYRWLKEKPDLGRVAIVDGRIVGFVGMVYADRNLGGHQRRIVNVCAWYLDKAHRGLGLGFELMRSATADEMMSYTILTSSSRTLSLLAAIGYRVLDDERYLWAAAVGRPGELDFEENPERILERIDDVARGMLSDHAGLPVRPVLIADSAGSCLAVFSVKRRRGDVIYFDVLHLGNPSFFAARAQWIADELLPRGEKAVIAVDKRLLQGHAHDGKIERLAVPRFCKSRTVEPWEIDNMYSEVQLLDLKLD